MTAKRSTGAYFTAYNPFNHPAFTDWAASAGLPYNSVLEPFAGSNSLIRFLQDMHLCKDFSAYDIKPMAGDVAFRDTLIDFPHGYSVCVTNPPWLAKNSARRRGLPFPDTEYDDIYKLALEKCLEHCPWVAALVPESFIRSGSFRSRLACFISLTQKLFEDTDSPTGLALFKPGETDTETWSGDFRIGLLHELESLKPEKTDVKMKFNDPRGNVGLVAIDNTVQASIRFCDPVELGDYPVRESGRSITRIAVDGGVYIEDWNDWLGEFRIQTRDVLLTSFKGMRKDGMYRRRLDFDLARRIIGGVV